MNRSGYTDDCENLGLWRGAVTRAIKGKRGQAFLAELAKAMDEMPIKELINDELIDKEGNCCTLGVVCKSRGLDISRLDYADSEAVARHVGLAHAMAAEIEYMNDEWRPSETPTGKWLRMRKWVEDNLHEDTKK